MLCTLWDLPENQSGVDANMWKLVWMGWVLENVGFCGEGRGMERKRGEGERGRGGDSVTYV